MKNKNESKGNYYPRWVKFIG